MPAPQTGAPVTCLHDGRRDVVAAGANVPPGCSRTRCRTDGNPDLEVQSWW